MLPGGYELAMLFTCRSTVGQWSLHRTLSCKSSWSVHLKFLCGLKPSLYCTIPVSWPKHPHLRQPLQPPKNANTLRQHTKCPAFFGFKGGHDVVVWVRSRAPACQCARTQVFLRLRALCTTRYRPRQLFRKATRWNHVSR